MAAARSKTAPVGSSAWIQSEREHAEDTIAQEVEEFVFSVRNEADWLHAHMADVYSREPRTVADMLKTPGKLRGKTPRTARKVNALAPRQPLTDIFAPNSQPAPPSAQKTTFYEKVAQFQIREDVENNAPTHKPVSRGTSPQRAGKPYTDSGYHGMMTEDEMELDMRTQADSFATLSSQISTIQKVPLRDDQPPPQRLRDAKADETGASDDSFVSAKEQKSQDIDDVAPVDEKMREVHVPGDTQPWTQEDLVEVIETEEENAPAATEDVQLVDALEDGGGVAGRENDVDMDMGDASPHSDASSPEKPLNRKSSFTFSSLPAREPLGSKRSMGQMDIHRNSVFNKSVGNKTADVQNEEQPAQEKATESRAHSKISAQLLHDRINLLGKTKDPRPSKSIPPIALAAQTAYPQLPSADEETQYPTRPFEFLSKSTMAVDDEDDDWIAPSKPLQTLQQKPSEATIRPATKQEQPPTRPLMHQKSISTTIVPSPTRNEMSPEQRHQKAMSVSHPNLAEALGSTTPAGSPARKTNEGHLSASKNRLWSALKSAKNIFASSASTSAAAKLEAHSTSPTFTRSPTRDTVQESHKLFNMPGAIWSKTDVLGSPPRNNSVVSFSPSRKTRHSNESDRKREKELKAQEKAATDLEKAREKERQKAAKQQAEEKAKAEKVAKAEAAKAEREEKERQLAAAQAQRPESAGSEKVSDNEKPAALSKSSILPAGKLRAPGRLMRPTKEPAKQVPLNIRVTSQAQRAAQGPSAPSSFSKSQHENLASSTASQAAGPRPGSAMGHRPGTTGGNSRVKALEAAARKKEADEKAAQKKADQKRELERKRAEKAEQEKRAEVERKAAEQQRAQEAKLASQRKAAEKQAAEARKREQDRADHQRREQERAEQQRREIERIEQQRRDQDRMDQQRREVERLRQEEEARKAKEAHDLAEAIRREREQKAQAHPRGDLPGTLRQLTKTTVPAVNPAKPAKRQFPAEDDDRGAHPQRPGIMRGPPSYQQTEAKRRKTNEEHEEQPNQRNSVMAPPKRPSTLRKETMNKFTGYAHAPPPAQHHGNMFKSTVTAQHQMQHSSKPMHPSQLVQTSNARIPFAENANPPAPHQLSQSTTNYDASKFKTPARPAAHAPKSAKSTPHYPQGDNIELPDIATDSEDEDDDDDGPGGFRAPSWTASPALRDLLTQQQLVDPEAVFGPIGELKMDEVFKNNKNQERLKRFRDRGSSALWVETGDAVTSAEKRRDMELRERVVREGGWRYEPNA